MLAGAEALLERVRVRLAYFVLLLAYFAYKTNWIKYTAGENKLDFKWLAWLQRILYVF